MNFDDLINDAWQAETRPAATPDLAHRVRRRQWRQRLFRGTEVAVTAAAVLVFASALVGDNMSARHWLLLPFYLVFLPVVWSITLRAPRRRAGEVSERLNIYAHLRMSQLRTSLRDLWLARTATWALVGYSLAANLAVWLLAEPHWRGDALLVLALAVAWLVGTLWLSARWRGRWLREYRGVRRLAG